MTTDDYNNLTKIQKLAIFLTLVGAETAAQILREFEDFEVEQICQEMATLELIDDSIQAKIIEEFSLIISESIVSVHGGYPYTKKTLELLKGQYQAQKLVSKFLPTRNSVEVIKEIGEMEPRQIYNLIKSEQAQAIAFILSYLSPRKAASIIELCPPESRSEIAIRMGTMESTSSNTISKVVKRLEKHLDLKGSQATHSVGGSTQLAEVLNLLDRTLSKSLLEKIEEQNSNLGASVRKRMFTFDDIQRLAIVDLQRLLRDIDTNSLALAIKPSPTALKDKIYKAMSKRAAESLMEEIEFMGAVRLKDVEVARESIITIVRKLEEDGEISLEGESNEFVS